MTAAFEKKPDMGEAPKNELDGLLGEFEAGSPVEDVLARLNETLAASPEVTIVPDQSVEVASVTPAIESAALHGHGELPVLRDEVPAEMVPPVVSESVAPVSENTVSSVGGRNIIDRKRGKKGLKNNNARGAKPAAAQVPATKATDAASQTASADAAPVAAAPEAVVIPALPVLTEVVPEATVPAASVEQEPTSFLTDEGRVYEFSGNSPSSQSLKLLRKGKEYFFVDEHNEPYTGWGNGISEEMITEQALREEWQSVLLEQEGARDVSSEDAPTVPAELDGVAVQESEEQSAWTKERLLALVEDGGEITLQSTKPDGNSVVYVREGEKFFSKGVTAKHDRTSMIVNRLKNGLYILVPVVAETIPEASESKTRPVAPENIPNLSLDDEVPQNELPTPTDTFENNGRYAFLSLGEGERLSFRDSAGQMGVITVERRSDGMYQLYGESGTLLPTSYDAASLRTIADEESWVLLDQDDASRENTKGQNAYRFFELNTGDALSYINENGEKRTVERMVDDSYRVLDGNGVSLGAPYDERYLLRLAEQEQWQLLDEEVVPSLTAEQDRDAKRDSFLKMVVGDKLTFVGSEGEVTAELVAPGQYKLYDADGIPEGIFDEAHVVRVAEDEGWFGEVVTTIDLPEAAETPEAGEAMSEIERLELMVSEARLEYVTIDYKQNSNWQKLRKVIGRFLSEVPNDKDTEDAQKRYEHALVQLQEAQLAALKNEPLTPSDLRERMAGMLRYYQLDERIKLTETRDEVKIENLQQKLPPIDKTDKPIDELQKKAETVALSLRNNTLSLLTFVEKMGREYNKLDRWQKFLIAAACGGAAIGAAVAGGAAAGTAAAGLAFVRKVVTTAGLGVTVDSGLKWWEGKRELEKVDKEIKEVLERVEGDFTTVEERLEGLKQFLQTDVARLNKRFQDQKGKDMRRHVLAWGGAFGGSFGLPYAWETWKEIFPSTPSASTDALTRPLRAPRLSGAASAPEVAPSAPASVASVPGQGVVTPAGGVEVSPVAPTAPTNALLSTYEVTEADGRRGLWGVLEKRLPSNVAAADRPRVIANLLKTLQDKVEDMSPEARVAAGLDVNGDLNTIVAGKTIDFEKLLTPQEIEVAGAGESVAKVARGAAEIADSVADAPQGAVPVEADQIEQARQAMLARAAVETPDPTEVVRQALAEDAMGARVIGEKAVLTAVTEGAPQADWAVFQNPQAAKEFLTGRPDGLRSLGEFRRSLFLTPALMEDNSFTVRFDYTVQSHMGAVHMDRVLETARELQNGTMGTYSYDRMGMPLHSSQVQNMVRLVSIAEQPQMFGALGSPLHGETINDYTRRITAMMLSSGKERQMALLFQGRTNLLI